MIPFKKQENPTRNDHMDYTDFPYSTESCKIYEFLSENAVSTTLISARKSVLKKEECNH